jgi:hypothetical protein
MLFMVFEIYLFGVNSVPSHTVFDTTLLRCYYGAGKRSANKC